MTTAARLSMASLTEGQVQSLRERYPYQLPSEWVGRLAARSGWQEANGTYLRAEQKRAMTAMRHLMGELGVESVSTPDEALDLVECAFNVFAESKDFSGTIERLPGAMLRVEVSQCPVYEALESSKWRMVTACPSWYRRRGWLDALGVQATDSLVGEKKWGDAACAAEIQIEHVT